MQILSGGEAGHLLNTFLGHSVLRQLSWILLFFLFILAASASLANDTEAVVAAGGIQFKHEPRISMEKERLFISEKKVTVDYDFLNVSDQDISTEIAFPVPPFDCTGYCGGLIISVFHVWVDGKELSYQREAKAMVKGRDYAEELNKLGVDIASFGHFDPDWNFKESKDYQIARLPQQDIQHLAGIGLIDGKNLWPLWTVNETYHWKQTFPARKIIHVRHEYPPAVGYNHVGVEDLTDTRKDKVAEALARPKGSPGSENDETYLYMAREIDSLCVDPSLGKKIKEAESERWQEGVKRHEAPPSPVEAEDLDVGVVWVEYILSTANFWKGPIKDFTLIVERPTAEGGPKYFVSFCWDGPVRRIDENHFEAHVSNFVPRKELHVGFFFPNT